ncbi:antitoxin VbhA family protein [Marasmitruncus massiliensis]|uniref:antitoxin VbhA family protein n=1 Tax=Marasmitruncus massiliensis TaxID=1944642 RepID=UPI000C7B87BB|nr:antitoxin VbhA family protein [Marasmitruncus massiliensis]
MTERTRRNLEYTLSTFAVEGLKPSKEAVRLYERMDEGKLSLKDAIAAIERKHGVAGEKRA